MDENNQDHYDKHAEMIQDLSTNPQKILDAASNNELLNSSLPELVPHVTAQMSSAVSFLDSKLPKPNNELPLSPEWKPSPSQRGKFNRYFEILNDPVEALTHVKNGTLSNEHMEALQTVYPDLLGEMRQKVLGHMDPKTARSLPQSVKIALSKFMGSPLSSSMLPSVVLANQATFLGAPTQQQQMQGKQSKSTVGGLSKLNVSELSKTRTQKLDKEDA